MKKNIFTLIIIASTIMSFISMRYFVPDEATAIKIAEAVWFPIYGEEIEYEKPYKAVLQGDTVWHVFGTLPNSNWTVNESGDSVLNFHVGGVAHLIIDKRDGKIWKVYHGK